MENMNKLKDMESLEKRLENIELIMTQDITLYDYSWGGLVKKNKRIIPWLFVFDNVLTKKECKNIIKVSNNHYISSRTSNYKGINTKNSFRTSYNTERSWTSKLKEKETKPLKILSTITSFLTGTDINNQEEVSIVRYNEGQYFKGHYDNFPIRLKNKMTDNGGNRIWTAMFYLSDVEEGGGTYFFPSQLNINPKPGRLVLWKNIIENKPNKKSFHAGLPIIEGTKHIANIWVRERIHDMYNWPNDPSTLTK